jgi:ABC-2 type transport system permease protein
MRSIWAIFRKDILLRFSSPSEWVFFLFLPLAFTYVLASVNYGSDGRVNFPVVDEAQTSLSAKIIAALQEEPGLRVQRMTRADAERRFTKRQIDFWLLLPHGIAEEYLWSGEAEVILYEQPNTLRALAVAQAVQTALERVSLPMTAGHIALEVAKSYGGFSSEQKRLAYFRRAATLAENLQSAAPERLEVQQSTRVSDTYDPKASASAGQLITWVFIPLYGISAYLAYERSNGTWARLLITPMPRALILVATLGGQVIQALIQMALLVLFGRLALGLPWGREPIALALLLISAALAAAAIGTTLGTFVRSEPQAVNLSILLGMLTALLGGCWYPLELFPQEVQTAVRVLPTTWAMEGLTTLLTRGGGVQAVLYNILALLGFAGGFFVIGLWRLQREVES